MALSSLVQDKHRDPLQIKELILSPQSRVFPCAPMMIFPCAPLSPRWKPCQTPGRSRAELLDRNFAGPLDGSYAANKIFSQSFPPDNETCDRFSWRESIGNGACPPLDSTTLGGWVSSSCWRVTFNESQSLIGDNAQLLGNFPTSKNQNPFKVCYQR